MKHLVLHLIKHGEETFRDTTNKNTWMISYDALRILWEKNTQAWLKDLPCPIDGCSTVRGLIASAVRFRGVYNDHYKNRLGDDSPELIPLDC